jgi:hypothetical protein
LPKLASTGSDVVHWGEQRKATILSTAWQTQECGGICVKPFVAMMDVKAIIEL